MFLHVHLLQNVSGLFTLVCDPFPSHISVYHATSQASASYKDNVSLIKKMSCFFKKILELRHETSQVAATQCEVCGHVVVLLENRHIMKRHYKYDIVYDHV